MTSLTLFAPAKLNLFLAITGRRSDGFHDLVSLAAPLALGDDLSLHLVPGEGVYSLDCDDATVPLDQTNLVIRAAQLFAEAAGWRRSVHFQLTKKIPLGAGLGGGSSDGTAALLGLNQLSGMRLAPDELARLAAQLGSDCALFLERSPCLMRGRGEVIERLSEGTAARIRGKRLLVFKPSFGIPTAWAYRQMAASALSHSLSSVAAAEAHVAAWIGSPAAPLADLMANTLEKVAFAKYLALPTLLETLRARFQVPTGMSGSGSACYLLLEENTLVDPLMSCICEAWGDGVFAVDTRFG